MKHPFKAVDRVGVGGWGGYTGTEGKVYGWITFAEFAACEPERVDALAELEEGARRGLANRLLLLTDDVFVVPPAAIKGVRGLERVDLAQILDSFAAQDDATRLMAEEALARSGEPDNGDWDQIERDMVDETHRRARGDIS